MATETITATSKRIHIFVNRRKVELDTKEMTGGQLLEESGFEGQAWELYRLQGEGDPSGGQLIQAGESLHLKNGDRFRVMPGNRTFGA